MEIILKQKDFFKSGRTLDIKFRIAALDNLKKSILKHENDIYEALYADLNKSKFESFMTEIGMVLSEINVIKHNLIKWSKPSKVKTPLALFKAKSFYIPEPYGNVLIIAPWNYPFQLSVLPIAGAIAAGNTVILKTSKESAKTGEVINKILSDVFPPEYVLSVKGDDPIARTLPDERFDYIFFTGSVAVGKMIMEKASKYLTPVTLELGGKSPCIVNDVKDMKLVARRIAFGKLINSGQTCIAPDYLLIKKNLKDEFIKEFISESRKTYGNDAIKSEIYPKIINEKQRERLINLINASKVIYGGTYDDKKINPTLLDSSFDSEIMKEEIFGPILPIITYDDIDDVLKILVEREKPLAFYLFTEDKELQKKVSRIISFGGMTINDTLMHVANENLGFGGIGNSGMGSYHGKKSFDTFTHYKPIVIRSTKFDIKMRYLPGSEKAFKLVRKFMK